MESKQNCLVAGGAGFIGSFLVERLLNAGFRVFCLDNLLTSSEKNIDHLKANSDFKFINHDVTKHLSEELPKIGYIFHLASPASPNHHSKTSYHSLPFETMMANSQGTLNLLNLSSDHKARFLYASTSEVYGDPLENPQKEEYRGNVSTTGPRSVYDESKRFGETLTAFFGRDKGVDVRIARIFNTYGPRMSLEDKRMVVSFIFQALRDEVITVFGDGSQTRSLLYIDDLIDGIYKLMFTEGLSGEVVNLGSEIEHTVLEFAEIIKRATNSSSKIECIEDLPEDDPKMRRADISKARKLLNFEPKISLKMGLDKTIAYYNSLELKD